MEMTIKRVALLMSLAGAVSAQYQPRVNYGALYEPVNGVIHGAGQAYTLEPQNSAFDFYSEMMTQQGTLPLTFMDYMSPRSGASYYNSVKTRLDDFERAGQYVLPQFGFSLPSGTNTLTEAQLTALSDGLKSLERPLFLRVGYEVNGVWYNPEYQPANYIAEFRRVVDRLRTDGVPAAMLWNMYPGYAGESGYKGTWAYMSQFYPGDAYVDWFSFDSFSTADLFSSHTQAFIDQAHAHGKPVMIGEATPRFTGADHAADWPAWFVPFFSLIKSNPGIKGHTYINWDWAGTSWNDWGMARLEAPYGHPTVRTNYLAELSHAVYVHAAATAPAFVDAINRAPDALTLSNSRVAEEEPAGTAVGTFSTSDLDLGDTFVYALVAGDGDADNASFAIGADTLVTAEALDFEAKKSCSIRVRTTDREGRGFERNFVIEVLNVNALPLIESFESHAAGLDAAGVPGWDAGTGHGEVVEIHVESVLPPGYPLPLETHTRVLRYAAPVEISLCPERRTEGQAVQIDMMTLLQRGLPGNPMDAMAQTAFCTDENGHLNAWHGYHDGAVWTSRWSVVDDSVISPGQWVRISVAMDYSGNPDGGTFFSPRLNGSLLPSAHGFRAPTDLRSPGPWYLCANSPGIFGGSGGTSFAGVAFSGFGHVDDLVVTDEATLAHTGPTGTNGVPFVWFDRNGLARNPARDSDVDGLSDGGEYLAGSDPRDPASAFRVVGFRVENDRVVVEFTGNDSGAQTPYIIERAANLTGGEWETVDANVPRAHAPAATTIWAGPVTNGTPAFYRPRAVP